MAYGPCGGVNADGTCEVHPTPCVFLTRDLPVRWTSPTTEETDRTPSPKTRRGGDARRARAGRDRRAATARVHGLSGARPARRCRGPTAEALIGSVDAVLSGDAGRSRVQFPPSYRATLIGATGLRVWMGFNARDRNRTALERELLSLRALGVAGVHCVTGDHTQTGDRPDARPVFDLESTTTLPRAAALGLLTSFAESPAAPPIAERGARVAEKQRAGEDVPHAVRRGCRGGRRLRGALPRGRLRRAGASRRSSRGRSRGRRTARVLPRREAAVRLHRSPLRRARRARRASASPSLTGRR
jgi:hypothetical protein